MYDLTKILAALVFTSAVIGCATDEPTDDIDVIDDGSGGGDTGGGDTGSGGGGGMTGSGGGDTGSGGGGGGGGGDTGSVGHSCVASPDSCTGDNVCVAGTCELALGRVYTMTIVDGSVTERDANGVLWDGYENLGGGIPDPYVNVYLNGVFAKKTAFKSDTLMPAWNESATITVAAGASIQIDARDDDYGTNTVMFSCFGIALTPELLRKHGGAQTATCSPTGALSSATVRFFFEPQ